MPEALRPYLATALSRFLLTLQYRAAAVAGFFTQSWFGAIMIMVLAAFYAVGGSRDAPLSLAQAVTYVWMSQALISLSPWSDDPNVAAAVRTGSVAYDRLRPVDAYAWWYASAAGWMTARMVPRAALIFAFSGIVMPLLGFGDWSWRLPASPAAAGLFAVSLVLIVLVSSAIVMLLNLCTVVTVDNRGVISLVAALNIVLSGNLLPLPLYPDWAQAFLFVQPFASVLDIPARIWTGQLTGDRALMGIALQAFWAVSLFAIGRSLMGGVMQRLQVQGG